MKIIDLVKKGFKKLVNKYSQNTAIIPEVRIILRAINFWPAGPPPSTKTKLLMLVSCLLPFWLIVPQFWYMFANIGGNINDLLENICPMASCVVTNIKQFSNMVVFERLRILINRLQENWNQNITNKNFEIQATLKECKKFCNILTFWYTFGFIILCLNYALHPIAEYLYFKSISGFPSNYTMLLPYKTIYPWNLTNGYNFEFTYVMTMVAVYFLGLSLSGFDCMFMTSVRHVTTQFRILNINIANLKTTILEMNNYPDSQDVINRELIKCIKEHKTCISMVYNLEDAFNMYLFIQFASSSIILCIVCFQMVIVSK